MPGVKPLDAAGNQRSVQASGVGDGVSGQFSPVRRYDFNSCWGIIQLVYTRIYHHKTACVHVISGALKAGELDAKWAIDQGTRLEPDFQADAVPRC